MRPTVESRHRGRFIGVFARGGVFLLVAFGSATAGAKPTDTDCLKCHGDAKVKRADGKALALASDALPASVHGAKAKEKLACVDCHADLADTAKFPHEVKLAPAACTGACHADIAKKHPFHPQMVGDPTVIACQDCHGGHDAVSVKDASFKFARANQAEACGTCHESMRDEFKTSQHGTALAAGAKEVPDCVDCHKTALVTAPEGAPKVTLKQNQVRLCLSCHLDSAEVRAKMVPSAGFIKEFGHSVHGEAIAAGKDKAPSCSSCHGAHDIKKGQDTAAKVNPMNVADTCGECHEDIARAYKESVHGVQLAKGNHDSPTCTKCHGEHDIRKKSDPSSRTAAANVSARVCEPCHASLELAIKYDIPSDRFKTFEDSFHGLAGRGRAAKVANCASCHGSHDIRPSSDPTSRISKARLVETCGKCHPGANQRFTVGAVHSGTTRSEPILYWISVIYLLLIFGVIGFMALHNALDFVRKSRHQLAIRRGEIHEEPAAHRMYLRMTATERWMHIGLAVSFIALVITGFMVRYPEAWWVKWIWRAWPRAFDMRGVLHRIAAVVQIATAVWHVLYVAFTRRGRQFVIDMLPGFVDVREFFAVMKYNLGLSDERPRLGRFCYVEKAEYWALIWGTIVMTTTGLIMWFDNRSLNVISKLGYDVARLFHFYEAWLAALAIAVWHFYAVLFSPAVYPMNLSWITGLLSEREMEEEHPRELEKLKKEEEEAGSNKGGGAAAR